MQSNHSITEAGLFGIYININFPPFGINMGISGLGSVLETTRISELEQMTTSGSNVSGVFSQINSNFGQPLPLPSGAHSQQQGHTGNLAPSSVVDMQAMFQTILQSIKAQLAHLHVINKQCE